MEPLFYVHEGLPLASFGLSGGIGARGLRRSLFRVWVLGLGIGIFTFLPLRCQETEKYNFDLIEFF